MRVASVVLFLAGLVVCGPLIFVATGAACDENCSGDSGGLLIGGLLGLAALWAGAGWLMWRGRSPRKPENQA
mgnify:CR=1 FL=1